ncbi:biliverdin-producing heme oxygenase [Herbaspirillum sp. alder98]|uniref:biliverdin-producing heme oxygenase n=1 Tax=Herbaspirillum sp. alder98 TaxID=2913096 RepID=UPI001CD8C2CA|nr:biliverdin-producing heme oxygenase [Herbaspirillum sp. alder98]MCA1325218.1 biliverdin-producing heme oxygenase [Herbaspirillum sp. alder98]
MSTPLDTLPAASRAAALKAATHAAHQRLDSGIMQFDPFGSRQRYGAFVQMQYAFHRDVAALFDDVQLNHWFPGLQARARLRQIERDLADLGLALPALTAPPVFVAGATLDRPTALGWLYVEEGSNLGAAFLFKAAAALGFDGQHGARHLAPHEAGRAPSWRAFVAQLDSVALSPAEDARATAGAIAAFDQVTRHTDMFCRDAMAGQVAR